MTTLENIVNDMRAQLNKIAEVILGDPADETKPGVMIRLDRLERSNQVKTKIMWILATGILVAAGEAVLSSL